MSVAVIPADGTEPVATFPDMATAMAWGLQQYKGHPFVVRVFADGAQADASDDAAPCPMPLPPRRPPTAKAAAVANVLRTARKAAAEEFRVEERLKLRAAAH